MDKANWTESLFGFAIALYKNDNFAYQIAQWMIIIGALLMVIACLQFVFTRNEIKKRSKYFPSLYEGVEHIDEQREHFADDFNRIDSVMKENEFFPLLSRAKGLALSWLEFKETLIDETETPIQNTVRPHSFFARSVQDSKWLDFTANISVGIGLLFTFLGLVAALKFANDGIESGNMAAMQTSLQTLLSAASAKFVTSIVGVGLSILMKIEHSILSSRIKHALTDLSDHLEKGLLYVPPQKLAADQMHYAKEQSTLLKELAMEIGMQFQKALEPLNNTMQAQSNTLRDGISDVISDAASAELKHLAGTLDGLTQMMSGLDGNLKASGDAAATQIREAASSLSALVVDMPKQMSDASKQAADELAQAGQKAAASFSSAEEKFTAATNQLSTIGPTLERWELATDRAVENISQTLDGFQSSLQSMNSISSQLTQAGSTLASQLENSESRILSAAKATENATTQAEKLYSAITETQLEISNAWKTHTARFGQADEALGRTVNALSDSLEAFQEKIRGQVSDVDRALGSAVSNLAGAIEGLQETIADLDDRT